MRHEPTLVGCFRRGAANAQWADLSEASNEWTPSDFRTKTEFLFAQLRFILKNPRCCRPIAEGAVLFLIWKPENSSVDGRQVRWSQESMAGMRFLGLNEKKILKRWIIGIGHKGKQLRVCDLESGKVPFDFDDSVVRADFAPDGSRLIMHDDHASDLMYSRVQVTPPIKHPFSSSSTRWAKGRHFQCC